MSRFRNAIIFLTGLLLLCSGLIPAASALDAPSIYSNIHIIDGNIKVMKDGKLLDLDEKQSKPAYSLLQLSGSPKGVEDGFIFTFEDKSLGLTLEEGTLHCGLWSPDMADFPLPKYRYTTDIKDGRAVLPMNIFKGKTDAIEWEKNGRGYIFYRVTDGRGRVLHDALFLFSGNGPFQVENTIEAGPTVNKAFSRGATISFRTTEPIRARVTVDGVEFTETEAGLTHEIDLTGLAPDTFYRYEVRADLDCRPGSFRTAPVTGSGTSFVFAYGSDSRGGITSGDRNVHGVNQYILFRFMALAAANKAAFIMFTGDTMGGYSGNVENQELEYANWRQAIQPFAPHIPIFVGMGNHETLDYVWKDGSKKGLRCDRFPFADKSSEALFSKNFINPENGPISEDDSPQDPHPGRPGDFPPYKESVYSFEWGNLAMIVLNSQYLMAVSLPEDDTVGGNLWGYLMDNQIQWLAQTLDRYQNDSKIDHILITQHTPMFPNGGHYNNYENMYYFGDNSYRPVIKGVAPEKFTGFIDRRDEYLKLLLDHDKVRAILVGDEHNYYRMSIHGDMPIYNPKYYVPEKPLKLTRRLWEICNGSVGAPFYARVSTPWNKGYPDSPYLKKFSVQHALVLIHVEGKELWLEVLDPETLNYIEKKVNLTVQPVLCK